MNQKYLITGIGIVDKDTKDWYKIEQCWNCEPDDLRKIQVHSAPRSCKHLYKTNRH